MFKILVTGDFCPIGRVEQMLLANPSYNIFGDFARRIETADLAITNLECPVLVGGRPAQKVGPALRAHPSILRCLSNTNIRLVTLANNHTMDYGVDGLSETLRHLSAEEINYVGAGVDRPSAEKPFIVESKGLKIGILNFAENEFINANGSYPGCNSLDLVRNFYQIRQLREVADAVIVVVHGGNETFWLPSPRWKQTLRYLIDIGADAVVGHHSHCFNGYEVYNGKPIFYGIGNFLFDYSKPYDENWCLGVAVELMINVPNKMDFKVHPFYQNYKEDVGIRLLKTEELCVFNERVCNQNRIIQDDELLNIEFGNFIRSVEKQYKHFLQPYSSKYLHKLFSVGVLPSVFRNARKRLLYLNLIRCESHRDIVLDLLKDENRHS